MAVTIPGVFRIPRSVTSLCRPRCAVDITAVRRSVNAGRGPVLMTRCDHRGGMKHFHGRPRYDPADRFHGVVIKPLERPGGTGVVANVSSGAAAGSDRPRLDP